MNFLNTKTGEKDSSKTETGRNFNGQKMILRGEKWTRIIVHSNKKNNYKTNSNADITEEKQKSIKNKRNACVCKCANQFGQKKMRPAWKHILKIMLTKMLKGIRLWKSEKETTPGI